MNNFTVRLAKTTDMPSLFKVYERARAYMKQTGNPTQWGSHYPTVEMLSEDVAKEQLYVLESEGSVCGAFVFFVGVEPNYSYIEGEWSCDKEYGVIHKVASDGTKGGVFGKIIEFVSQKANYLRIDTHKDNLVMQNLIKKNGFIECGIVYMADDGTPRIAFDRITIGHKR